MVDLDEGVLFAAFLLPSHKCHGIGRRLVQPAEEALFERHAVARLETGKATREAGFYRWLSCGDERDFGGGDVRMEKRGEILAR